MLSLLGQYPHGKFTTSTELASLQGRAAHQTSTLMEMSPSPPNQHLVDYATTPVSHPGFSLCSWWLAAW